MSFRITDRNRRGGTITINKILINKTEKMKVKKVLTLAIIAVCSMGMISCTAETKKQNKLWHRKRLRIRRSTRMLIFTKMASLIKKLQKSFS